MAGQPDADGRTEKYGGGDGVGEHERADSMLGEDQGTDGTPTDDSTRTGESQAERKQAADLESGEEQLG